MQAVSMCCYDYFVLISNLDELPFSIQDKRGGKVDEVGKKASGYQRQ
jgi:hypothetical protein